MPKYKYYTLSKAGKRKEEFLSFTDIAFEFGVTKGSIAGKFYRAHMKNNNIIQVNNTRIEATMINVD